ncbi:MAG: putative fatty acid methyltransferase [Acidimicrobiales bacterium]|nr:putative fatty acid methyltransferase [Acidimicrobiales bacterium]
MTVTAKRQGDAAELIAPAVRRLLGVELPIGLRAWDGSVAGPPDPPVTVVIHSPMALRRMLWAPGELGLARAHVAGEIDIEGDIFALLGIRDHLVAQGQSVDLNFGPAGVVALVRAAAQLGVLGPPPPAPDEEARARGRRHSRRRDAVVVSHHYDVGNEFYRLVLGLSWTYSCAYWASPDVTLEQAQEAKYELICRKLGLRPGMRLLDVGCGWGSMAIHAAREHGVQVVGVTLSREQQRMAMARVTEAGLDEQVEIRLQDYRNIHDGPFEAISSIGMFEHVGIEQMRVYLGHLHDLLVPGGRLLNHAISRPEPSSRAAVDPRSFIGRYVFPDSALIEVGTVISAMQDLGLEVRDVQSLREHYARTLRAWITNLEQGWEEAQHLAGPARARIWRLYMAGSAIGFEQNRTSIHQVLAVRTPSDGTSAMPATRASFEVDRALDSTVG